MGAVVVEQQNLAARLDVAGENVPAGDDEILSFLQERGVGQAAGGDDHHGGIFRQDLVGLGVGVEPRDDTQSGALLDPPVDDPDDLAPAPHPRGEPHLSTGLGGGLEQHHPVAARRRHPCRLQPGRAGADDHHRPRRTVGGRDRVGHRRLASGRRIMDAQRFAALVDAVDAVAGADAGPDLVLAALGDLAGDMGIGEMGAGHPDHVDQARGHRMARRRHVVDAGGVEHRRRQRRPDLAGEVEVGRRRRSHVGDHVAERLVGVDVAADDVEEVELAGRRQPPGDRQPLLPAQTLVPGLVRHHADADDVVGSDRGTNGVDHLEGRPHPIVQRAAVGVGPPVGRRRPESIEEVAVGLDLDPVEAGLLAAGGGGGVGADDPGDVPVLGLLRERPVGRLADRRGRDQRQPVGLVPVGSAAEMGDLAHHRRAVAVAGIGQLPQPRNDLVLVDMEVAERRRRVLGDDRRAAGDGQRDPALRLLLVIEPVTFLRQAVLRIGRLVGGRHDPVAKGQVTQPERLHQGIVGTHRRDRL